MQTRMCTVRSQCKPTRAMMPEHAALYTYISVRTTMAPGPPCPQGVPRGLGTHVDLLGGEGADAHTCGVSLHHTIDVPNVLGGDAQPRAHTAHCAVG